MKFLLTSTNCLISEHNKFTGVDDKIIESIRESSIEGKPKLEEISVNNYHGLYYPNPVLCVFIHVNKIEDLKVLYDIIDEMFIIDFEGYDNTPEIEIYNDYRE